jgi:hypothetical protein
LNFTTNLFSSFFSNLSNDKTPTSSWATGSNTNWTNLKQGFKGLSVHFEKASEAAAQQVWYMSSVGKSAMRKNSCAQIVFLCLYLHCSI